MMRHDDQLQMHVSTVCFLSLFCPKDKSPKTLDVLAGVRPDGTPLKNGGPELEWWIQKHPVFENRSVNVLVLKRHVSQEFKNEWESSIDDLKFQLRHGGGDYVRFATKGCSHNDAPMLIFGNSTSTTNYKATTDMHRLEADILIMTKFMHCVIDNELERCLDKLKNAILNRPL